MLCLPLPLYVSVTRFLRYCACCALSEISRPPFPNDGCFGFDILGIIGNFAAFAAVVIAGHAPP
ncbi:MAG: hypothetical protein NC299_03680 [Lachnospiraceae bacterium]|nr:hypothetical protein [Ruminococcus sp.]MCM1274449.1 hypothetical protein [Lachnospiraceae bacterium]